MYRGLWADDEQAAAQRYADLIKETIFYNTSGHVALMLCEPIQGAGGMLPQPKGFMTKAAKHVRDAGGLFLSDEVQTGFGRTGTHYWGFEKYAEGTIPDMVSMAKSIGNGLPISAIACSKEVASSLKKITFDTYSSNPLSIVAAREVLKIIDDEGIQANALARGQQFEKGVKELQKEYRMIGQIRGSGCM